MDMKFYAKFMENTMPNKDNFTASIFLISHNLDLPELVKSLVVSSPNIKIYIEQYIYSY